MWIVIALWFVVAWLYWISVRALALRTDWSARYHLFSLFGRSFYVMNQHRSEPFGFQAPHQAFCIMLSGWMVETLGEDSGLFRMLRHIGQRWDYVTGGWYRVADCSFRGSWFLMVVYDRASA